MVTFDKGGRVARLEAGLVLDARQTGILFAQSRPSGEPGRTVELLDWDDTRDPAATRRIQTLVATRGRTDKQTLLLALSMGVLRRYAITEMPGGVRFVAEGDRSRGYTLRRDDA